MKTNKLYTVLVGALVTIGSISCSDFLDRAPLDQMSSETFWQSEVDVEMALTGCYRRLRDEQYFGWKRVDLDCLTDNAQQRHNHGAVTDISRGVIEKTTGGIISAIWGSAYKGINTCNYFLENIARVPGIDEQKKNRYMAEARFLRAFFYFELVHFFGDAPLYRDVPTVETASIRQSPKAELLAFIHEDLDFAIQQLPDVPYTDGHVVKGSAQGYKARILMYEEQFAEAAALCKEIIDAGNFQLGTSYSGLFITPGQANNPEIMFSTRYVAPDDYTEMDIQVNWWSSNNPRQEFVDAYETTDGKAINDASGIYDPDQPYENRDPRLEMTVMLPDEVWLNPDGSPYTPEHTTTGYRQKKYIDPTIVPIDYATRSDQDYVHLRFADILLMYAEAQNEANGPDQSVIDAINRVRNREDVQMPPVEMEASKDVMREVIRHERRIELALEGLRYFDLKRWHIAHEVMPNVQDAAGVPIRFDNPKHYLWPYQQSELDINPNLEPNPNYE
ncbi:RagB/SusD family nutrient uptake outer membrane protein [Parapedobacter indicus]|uniref:Starch-binding associating with outer membrane n=1 Tax=Parapedobacter indicus TaxID=1477437 RepID=A0A1I3S1Y3_9SPHI|nr:RagB/SusD family nutrient uptake outer membrane protein [Parapedobacter indicus]PPK99927.1 putative outer membrane starch-binding protein [Parapedobacter indicus]SFJ51536.1 Starch-binding associating with outer membrane [Parapedobacter indicus]